MDIRNPKPGDPVVFTDMHGVQHNALITAVHGSATESAYQSVNLVYVTDDSTKRDPYGLQLERSTSTVHRGQQSAHGMFWDWPS